jgi:hypothetical protein
MTSTQGGAVMSRMLIIAVGLSLALTGPTFARQYFVFQNSSSMKCHIVTRKMGGSERQLGKVFSTKSAAEAALRADASCK